jgi:hypothetical protein
MMDEVSAARGGQLIQSRVIQFVNEKELARAFSRQNIAANTSPGPKDHFKITSILCRSKVSCQIDCIASSIASL